MDIGAKIRSARIAKGLTQEELGEILGVQKSAIAKYENGRIVNIKRSTLKKISDVLGIPPYELVYEHDQSPSTYVDAVIKKMPPEELQLEEGDRELLDLIRLMPPEMKAMYREALRAALKSQGLI